MENRTRKQLVLEERKKLIKLAQEDGFYLFEIGEIFNLTDARIAQILKVEKSNRIKK